MSGSPDSQCASHHGPAASRAALRAAVGALRVTEPRRTFPASVHAGNIEETTVGFTLEPRQCWDHALRTEVVAALLSRAEVCVPRPHFWLVRPGELDTEDLDLRWFAAAEAAYGEAGVPLTMVVLTKRGWRNPLTDEGVSWKRLRIRT